MIHRFQYIQVLCLAIAVIALAACSTTSGVEDGEMLYAGMKAISYTGGDDSEHTEAAKADIALALETAPTGSFFGSPYLRSPLPVGLWIWNANVHKPGRMAQWITSKFGSHPVYIDDVNPELRTTVAETVLQSYGFFHGNVDYKLIPGKPGVTHTDSVPRPLSAKIAYSVDMGSLFTIDSIRYRGFTPKELSLISTTAPAISRGAPFSVNKLTAECDRIDNVLRENGYFYSSPDYMHYLADTIQSPGKVQLQMLMTDSVPLDARSQWRLKNTVFKIRRSATEEFTDTVTRRNLTVMYNGRRSPLRPGVLLQDMRIRPGALYSESAFGETKSRIMAKGIFSSLDISFQQVAKPYETADSVGLLQMLVDCVLDQPYSLSLSSNYTHKSSGRGGPGVGLGFTKSNAFRGGEKLTLNLNGSLDFRFSGSGLDKAMSYDLGGDITLEMPRLLLPDFMNVRRRWYNPPSTVVRLSAQTINRSGYFRRNIFSTELLYNFQPTACSRHSISPITVDYSQLSYHSETFDSIMGRTMYGLLSMKDNLIPKMRYTYQYNSPASYRNPVSVSFTFIEAGNVAGALSSVLGKGKWSERGKKLFNVEFSQFLKFEADWRKTWSVGTKSSLVAHAFAGYMLPYGNSEIGPFSEMYYVGGANDLRGFPSRGLGPGSFYFDDKDDRYGVSNGDFKLEFNLEYRFPLVSMLHGALFVDAGNVWMQKDYDDYAGDAYFINMEKFTLKSFPDQTAVSAGIGLRVDLSFFVLRLDWGFIVHAPYDTGRHGYFNTPKFSKAQCLNFAIGYPF